MDANLDGTVTDDNETRLKEAISLAKSGDADAARKILRQVLNDEPKNRDARELLVYCDYIDVESARAFYGTWFRLEAIFLVLGVIIALCIFIYILYSCNAGGYL